MRITATRASRSFSELLTTVSSGETVEIDRHGEVVAVVVPPPERTARQRTLAGKELVTAIKGLPRPDRGFADDVTGLHEVTAPPSDPWPS